MPAPLDAIDAAAAPFLALTTLAGLVLGSFATCAGHRLAHGGSVLTPARSYCPSCSHTLSWRENIPLLGWLLQGGKCRHCGGRISARYPLTELASGAYALCAGAVFGPSPQLSVALIFGTLCLVLSLIDLETYLLPDKLTLPGAVLAYACSALLPRQWTLGIGWEMALYGALAGGGGLWFIAWLYRRVRGVDGLGLGDAKLMLLFGALLGPAAVPVILFLGACLALPVGLVAMRGRQGEGENIGDEDGEDDDAGTGLRTRLPFGPFLCAAALGYLLAGPYLFHWWLGLPLP